MRTRIPLVVALASAGLLGLAAESSSAATTGATPSHTIGSHRPISYSAGTPQVAFVSGGGWTLAQGAAEDPGSGSVPYPSGFTGDPGPLAGYCSSGGPNPQTGSRVAEPAGESLPMQPYYFPFVTSSDGGRTLTGYFDYRPKDSDESVVAATSTDGGKHWTYRGQALELNAGVCPNGNTVDDGQGHAFVLNLPDRQGSLLYTLSRPAGDNPGVNLIVHKLHPTGGNPLAGLPASEPVGEGGSTTATAAVQIPTGPGPAGGGGVTVTVASTANFETSGQFTVDGSTVNCVDANMTDTSFDGCTTTNPAGVAIKSGDVVQAPPVIPAGAEQTSGLISPDGIVSVVPQALPGAPRHSISVLYTEKIVNYFVPTSTTAKVTLPAATIPVASTSGLPLQKGSITVSLGTANGIVAVTCTGEDATDLTGCTGGTGAVSNGSQVGAPGAAVAPYSTLALIGEGKNKSKSLFGNNEDYAVMRGAWTTDGIHFHDLGVTTGLSDPTSNAPGVLRWVGSRGTVIRNADGTLGLFQSGADVDQGDSDAFGEIFYSSSRDGLHWSAPQKLLGVDDTFSALAAQAAAGPLSPLAVSGYYSGRVYDPTVVQNRNGTVTMIFSGYGTPKPLPSDGTVLGTSGQYTVPANARTDYRTILTVTLTPKR